MPQFARRSLIRIAAIPLLACLIGIVAFTTTSDGSATGIPWSATTPLTWDLFRAVPPADAVNRTEAAAIHMTIRWHASYSVKSSGGLWTGHVQSATVSNTMKPSLSWAVPNRADDRVLQHEQAHFDLNEVYRRKLETALPCIQAQSATKAGVIDALDAALHRTADEVLLQLQESQAAYDAETRHGNDGVGQARWEALIATWLLNPAAAP